MKWIVKLNNYHTLNFNRIDLEFRIVFYIYNEIVPGDVLHQSFSSEGAATTVFTCFFISFFLWLCNYRNYMRDTPIQELP